MNTGHLLGKVQWEKVVEGMIRAYTLYAPVNLWGHVDYARIGPDNINQIVYNHPRPVTPLKTFLLPVKQNLRHTADHKRTIVMGIPSCDLQALDLLDAIYLDGKLPDPVYRQRRENTILIGSDCHHTLETCHCMAYGIRPGPQKNHDILLNTSGEHLYLAPVTEKGKEVLDKILSGVETSVPDDGLLNELDALLDKIAAEVTERNKHLPDYSTTGKIIRESDAEIWKKYAGHCVSCGACAAGCPTCSCFQLIDRPGFEKIRNVDTCQYPGFERVAAGEDPLKPLADRFRNRYMCKYVWKPARYNAVACTGCGRCIDACIGRINKNELIVELMDKVTA